jgi:EAL domain-containing protein (putative c-di-GMP-specific phosphodiesterase class I)
VRIALDDIGLHGANYQMILDCRPDYFKLDRYFVQGIENDPYRRAIVDSIARLARARELRPPAVRTAARHQAARGASARPEPGPGWSPSCSPFFRVSAGVLRK